MLIAQAERTAGKGVIFFDRDLGEVPGVIRKEPQSGGSIG